VADALTIVRLAPAWDQPAIRDDLQALPQAIAARAADGVIYQGRNTLTRLMVGGREVVAKAFATPRTVLKRVQRIGRDSKAVRAFDHAAHMRTLGIGTPEPFAAIEADDGRGWYLCAWAEGCTTFRQVSRENLPQDESICAALGAFIGHMHHVGAFHFDSTPGNILYRPDQQPPAFLVVDCNRMRFGRVGVWDGVSTLAQLDQYGRLLESYCAARGWQVARIRWWYRLRLTIERGSRALKRSTRPLRRKLGV
jgi:aminoglycoside phosphotransferase (APT) family kinase protein